jgi:protein tyrosine phosphatase (PTP) superfamily phosphohydrolase (DUF442 family)
MKRWHLIPVLLILLLAAAWGLAHRPNFHEIIPGEAYRSAQLSGANLKRKVRDNAIRTVINLRKSRPGEDWYDEEMAAVAELGIEHHSVPMFQDSFRVDQVLALHELLQEVERPFLVHCQAGADRTGLAAVLTVLLEDGASPQQAREQIAWKYGSVHDHSMGRFFLDQYEAWLADRGAQHDSEVLAGFLQTDFTDPTGNIHFLVHPINGQPWLKPFGGHEEGVEFDVSRADGAELALDGWAFDARNISPLAGLRLFLGEEEFATVDYGIYSPWLLTDFGRDEWLRTGWAASLPLSRLADGCHDLEFIFARLDGSTWASPPAGRICISGD